MCEAMTMAINRSEQNWPDGEVIDITNNHEQLPCSGLCIALDCAGMNEDEQLVSEDAGPFGEYYVHPAKRTRSIELRAALAALEDAETEAEYLRRTR
jgi:hypothetical protein